VTDVNHTRWNRYLSSLYSTWDGLRRDFEPRRNFEEADFVKLARFEAELDAFLVGLRVVLFLFRTV